MNRGITLFAALLLLGLSLHLVTPPSAEALPACGKHWKYYSDATYSNQVGGKSTTCSGAYISSWGQITTYWWLQTACCGPET